MFIGHEVVLDVSFRAAQARLANLVRRNGLSGASQAAFERGLADTIRVGPFGSVPGVSKLVHVSYLDPVYREDTMTVGLRWEATGVSGGLFPVLDADLSVTPAGERSARLALAGSYRPPFGRTGAALDRVFLGQVATATIRTLLQNVAQAIASPAEGEIETGGGLLPLPVTELE